MATNSLPLQVPDIDWYKDIVSGAPDSINIITRDGTILYTNGEDESPDEHRIVGHTIYEFFFSQYHEPVRQKIEQVFETGVADFYVLATDYNQQVDWYMTRIGPIIRNGEVVAASLFIRNINKLKQDEAALSQLNVDLEKRVDARAHEVQVYANHLEASEKLNTLLRKTDVSQDALKLLVKYSMTSLKADLAGVYKIQNGQLELAVSLQHQEEPPKVLSQQNDSFFFNLLQSRRTRIIEIDKEDVPNCGFCGYIANQQIHSMLVAPLRSGSKPDGVMYLGYCEPHLHSSDDEKLLNMFAESGSNTLHRIRVMEQLKENIQSRENEIQVLYEIMALASEARDQDVLLRQVLDIALEALGASIGVVHLVEPSTGRLRIAARKNFGEELESWFVLSSTSQDLWEKALESQILVEKSNLRGGSVAEKTGSEVKIFSYVGMPISAKERKLGVFSLFWQDPSSGQKDHIQMVHTIADQIGLSLEALFRRKETEEALIIEERQRLARDLHDSVSQSLYGLVLSADIGNKFLKMKAYPELNQTLTEIGEIALQSLKEMRLMLFELRPLTFDTVGLAGALELRLNTVEKHSGMETELEIRGIEFIPKTIDLEIYRIITEALNNSLKHSHAKKIHVTVTAEEEHIWVEVKDDGQGFSELEQNTGGIGLTSMKERARRISGNLVIVSEKELGTSVYIEIPLHSQSKGRGIA